MIKTNKMEDARGRRLFADLNHAFRKDPLMYVTYIAVISTDHTLIFT